MPLSWSHDSSVDIHYPIKNRNGDLKKFGSEAFIKTANSNATCCFVYQEREMMIAHFQGLKGEMNRLREIQRAQLTKLTLETNASVKEIQRKCRKVHCVDWR